MAERIKRCVGGMDVLLKTENTGRSLALLLARWQMEQRCGMNAIRTKILSILISSTPYRQEEIGANLYRCKQSARHGGNDGRKEVKDGKKTGRIFECS